MRRATPAFAKTKARYELGVEVPSEESMIPILRRLHAPCGDRISPARSTPVLRYHKFSSFPSEL